MNIPPDDFDVFRVSANYARRIDALCDTFEAALRNGHPLPWPELLATIPESAQATALEQLLILDRDLTREVGRVPSTLEHLRRELIGYEHLLDEVWPRVAATELQDTAAAVMPTLPTDVWPDRLRLIRQLGSGGMGTVYLAEHRLLGRQVAVKVPHSFGTESSEALQRFQREIRTLAQLQHPGLAAALDADVIAGRMFLVMEFVEGRTLQQIVMQQGVLAWIDAVTKLSQVAETLAFTHSQGVVHRDVTPGNLMVDASGRVRLLDLGLSRLIEDATQFGDQGRAFSGTPQFAAPEQQEGALPSPRADIYGLGSCLYFLLHGRPMYASDTLADLLERHRNADIPSLGTVEAPVPQRLEALFRRMVAKSPVDRPDSMDEVLQELGRLQTPPSSTFSHRMTRRRWILGSGAAIGVAAGTILMAQRNKSTTGRFTNSIGMSFANWQALDHAQGKVDNSPPRANVATVAWSTTLVSAAQYDQVMEKPPDLRQGSCTGLSWPEADEFCLRLTGLPAEMAANRRYRLPRESDWDELGSLQQVAERSRRANASGQSIRFAIQEWLTELSSLGMWSWCEDHLHARVGPRSIGNVPPAERIGQFPLRGGTGLFIHNFDLFMKLDESLVQRDRVELSEENDGRTRYFMPLVAGEPGLLVYHYHLAQPIRSARIFAKILAHQPTSRASLEVSGKTGSWKLVDEGFVQDSHLSPRDCSDIVQGGRELLVRIQIAEKDPRRFWAQALRTSPEPQLQFPNVYQVLAETDPGPCTFESRMVAPGSLRHPRIGLRLVCEIA